MASRKSFYEIFGFEKCRTKFYNSTLELHVSFKGAVTRGNIFSQLATQRRFKLHFTREIASCNASSLQNNPTAGHTTACICLQFYRSLKYLFHPNLRCKLQEKIAARVTWP